MNLQVFQNGLKKPSSNLIKKVKNLYIKTIDINEINWRSQINGKTFYVY